MNIKYNGFAVDICGDDIKRKSLNYPYFFYSIC